jgi:hypothetical protein
MSLLALRSRNLAHRFLGLALERTVNFILLADGLRNLSIFQSVFRRVGHWVVYWMRGERQVRKKNSFWARCWVI